MVTRSATPTVLHTIDTTGIGGAESVMRDIAVEAQHRGFRSIAALAGPGLLQQSLERNGVATKIIASGRWWDFRLLRGLVALCRAERVDLIHAHLPDHNFYASLVGRLAPCPVVATYHSPMELRNAAAGRERLKLTVVRRSASVAAVCDSVRDRLVSLGVPISRVTRIYNGVDVAAFEGARAADIRAELGWPQGTKVVGTVANVRLTKGYEHFVRAARRVVDVNPAARFVAAGDIDPVLGAPILALVRKLGLQEHVRFLGYRDDIPALLQALDVFVLPSTSEGFPLALLEAMAAGCVVVATRCGGGTEEIVEPGANGYLVPAGDARALCAGIADALAGGDRGVSLRHRARATARRFTTSAMVDGYEALYDRILGSRRSTARDARQPALSRC